MIDLFSILHSRNISQEKENSLHKTLSSKKSGEGSNNEAKLDLSQQALAIMGAASVNDSGQQRNKVISNINEIASETKKTVEQLTNCDLFNKNENLTDNELDILENYYESLTENWTKWQQECDSLKYKYGHKAIFEHFDITPKQLSDVHRYIESLHMSLLKFMRKQNPEYKELIPQLANKIMQDGTLEKLTQNSQQTERNDIPDNIKEWQTYWRSEYRDIDRPTSDPEKLKQMLGIV